MIFKKPKTAEDKMGNAVVAGMIIAVCVIAYIVFCIFKFLKWVEKWLIL